MQDETPAGLRQFGRSFALLLVLCFGLGLPVLFDFAWPLWPWLVALPVWFVAEVAPHRLAGLRLAWLKLGELLGRLTSPILLALVYFGLVTPLGWLKRLVGRRRIHRHPDAGCASYREPPAKVTRLEDPF